MSHRSRNWTFTLNNYKEDQIPTQLASTMLFFRFGREVSSTGTPHLQGFAGWKNQVRLATVKTWLPTAHWEVMRGTVEHNLTYCSKESELEGVGTLPMTKKQSAEATKKRWSEIMRLVKENSYKELERRFPMEWLKHHKKWTGYVSPRTPSLQTHDRLENYWVHGPSRTGKSSQIRQWLDQQEIPYYLKTDNKWWDAYNNEDWVIIEEVDPTWTGIARLKRWADRYPFPAEKKGTTVTINPKHIYVTSNFTLDECFPYDNDNRQENRHLQPMRERFMEVSMFAPYDYSANAEPKPFMSTKKNFSMFASTSGKRKVVDPVSEVSKVSKIND